MRTRSKPAAPSSRTRRRSTDPRCRAATRWPSPNSCCRGNCTRIAWRTGRADRCFSIAACPTWWATSISSDVPCRRMSTRAAERFRYNRRVFLAPPWPEIFRQDAERKQTARGSRAHLRGDGRGLFELRLRTRRPAARIGRGARALRARQIPAHRKGPSLRTGLLLRSAGLQARSCVMSAHSNARAGLEVRGPMRLRRQPW